MADPPPLLTRLHTLGDMARLRMLRLLDAHELSVGELARALQIPQSTVSRHLKLLHEGGWVVKRTEGTASLYRIAGEELDAEALALWTVARGQMGEGPTLEEDDRRLREVLAERHHDSSSFFGRLGGEWDSLRDDLFGRAFTADALLALALTPGAGGRIVVDVGCGTGNAAALLAPFVTRVIAVDREPAMLDAARTRLRGCGNVEFRQGDALALPVDDASVDAVLFFLVLHHLAEPTAALAEARRVLRDRGVILVVDMVAHDRESYRHTMGHQHLGFPEHTLRSWAKSLGLRPPRTVTLRPDTNAKGPGLFVATMEMAPGTVVEGGS